MIIIILEGAHPSSNTFMIAVLIRALLKEVSKEKTLSLIICNNGHCNCYQWRGQDSIVLDKSINFGIIQCTMQNPNYAMDSAIKPLN